MAIACVCFSVSFLSCLPICTSAPIIIFYTSSKQSYTNDMAMKILYRKERETTASHRLCMHRIINRIDRLTDLTSVLPTHFPPPSVCLFISASERLLGEVNVGKEGKKIEYIALLVTFHLSLTIIGNISPLLCQVLYCWNFCR